MKPKGDIYGPVRIGEKTEGESARSICADGRQRAKGKEEFYPVVRGKPCAQGTKNGFECWLE